MKGLGYGTCLDNLCGGFHPYSIVLYAKKKSILILCPSLLGKKMYFLWSMNFLSASYSSRISGNIKGLRQQQGKLSEHKDVGSFNLFEEIMVSATPLSWD